MRKNFLLVLLFFCVNALFASDAFSQGYVNERDAEKIGANFISNIKGVSTAELTLFHVEKGDDGTPCLYIFNVDGGGFVLVSGSKRMRPVLAYSDVNSYSGEIPSTAMFFIERYREEIGYLSRNDLLSFEGVEKEWEMLASNVMPEKKNVRSVAPLIQTQWNQDCYYNALAPVAYSGPCGRCYAGCVACAMSQVMKYWNYPEKGIGSHSYHHSEYGDLSANFGSTTYDWDNMPNAIWSDNDAIATLMYHCGISVDMNFSPSGSGAQSRDVETAMRRYFGYSAATFCQRSNYEEDAWIQLLKDELDESRPMYFSGSGSGGGHAIVCDGYDYRDYFHFNLGWSGYADGYYNINDVAGFNQNETVVKDIYPMPIVPDENGIIYVASDGQGDGSSWANATPYFEYATALACDVSKKIWVKSGTYYGNIGNSNGAFVIYPDNRVYGGFAGDESPDFNLDDRDFEANPTILDGQGSRRVVYQSDHFTNAAFSVWDGFTIQNGNAGTGAGAYLCCNSRFFNCKFINNCSNGFGGAVHIISAFYENATVKFENCLFDNNIGSMGGALCDMMGAQVSNCRFSNNKAQTKGGAYYIFSKKESKFVNTVFDHNSAKIGGALYNKGDITMINCNIVNNEADESCGGLYNESSYNKIYNSVFWGNIANNAPQQVSGSSKYSYCAVQGGLTGTNIIDLSADNDGDGDENYPFFVDPSNGDYCIENGSALIDVGNKSVTGVSGPDFLGNQRIVGEQIDIGAVEYQGTLASDEIETAYSGVFPNPIDNHLFVNGDGRLSITVFDVQGKMILSLDCSDYADIDTSNWIEGVYFVNVNGVVTKVVK
ncbi:MAG: C10 family peptidase [Candidatus Limimorpha sp.]